MKSYFVHLSCINSGEIHIGPFASAELAQVHMDNWPSNKEQGPNGWQWEPVIDCNGPVGTLFPPTYAPEIVTEIESYFI